MADLNFDLLLQASKNEEKVISASLHFKILSNLILFVLKDPHNPLKSVFS